MQAGTGALKIIDRKKHLIKLSQGEYVPLEAVETRLKPPELLEQLWVHGDSLQRRLVAVAVPRHDV
jgi:long-chain acyl-CoA synthetase